MTEIGFYHLQRTPLVQALPRLLDKAVAAGHRVVVKAPDVAAVQRLDVALWTYNPQSFLPHGTDRDGFADQQPIYLTSGEENPNAAGLLVLIGGAESAAIGTYTRCLDLFDGADPAEVDAARRRWRVQQAAGHSLTYWQQNDAGGWGKKA
ncbi:MAG TPA: DNA polymerase III subunit chi [Stellaceae bacterium]|nr:DNA polymerase III subunit chi [Stellaceae bacterium]